MRGGGSAQTCRQVNYTYVYSHSNTNIVNIYTKLYEMLCHSIKMLDISNMSYILTSYAFVRIPHGYKLLQINIAARYILYTQNTSAQPTVMLALPHQQIHRQNAHALPSAPLIWTASNSVRQTNTLTQSAAKKIHSRMWSRKNSQNYKLHSRIYTHT